MPSPTPRRRPRIRGHVQVHQCGHCGLSCKNAITTWSPRVLPSTTLSRLAQLVSQAASRGLDLGIRSALATGIHLRRRNWILRNVVANSEQDIFCLMPSWPAACAPQAIGNIKVAETIVLVSTCPQPGLCCSPQSLRPVLFAQISNADAIDFCVQCCSYGEAANAGGLECWVATRQCQPRWRPLPQP